MGNRDNRSLVLLQMALEPLHTLCVKVVGRLVQQKHVRLAQQQTAEGHPPALATAEISYLGIRRRTLQGIHRPLQLGVDLPSFTMLYFLRKFALTYDELIHFVVGHRLAELQVHLLILPEQVHHFLYAFLNHLQHRLFRVH